RGRIDLLHDHLRRDPDLLQRTFSHQEIYPPELGCHADESLALHGTPLAGTTLLHLCVDYDEIEIARWLIERGADVNAKAEVDAEGFGGHTPLFGCVVSQPYRVGRRKDDAFARLLLDHGADPNARASLRKRLRFVADESMHEYRDVTPLAWGERFHDRSWVSGPVMRLIADRGGRQGPAR
ncbi:MAG: ankyrin repeat domain-containing protein, partial [Gammaproteobacteria bacterium]|nr:ankyrin repeat domain-containing protein [Gammaproteobacteria bacterium]